MGRRVALAWMLMVAVAGSANAQNGSTATSTAQSQPGSSATSSPPGETRPATTTFFGDTGLWFVPTAEVLPHGKWSGSGYRRGTNFVQGFSNVGDFAGTFGVGIKNRLEIFGSFLFDTRIDRDLRPLFISDSEVGGIIDRYPRMRETWSGDNVGDFYLGAKYGFWSEADQKPAALAVRVLFKAPTGDDEAGASTGSSDFGFDFIASKEMRQRIDLSGYAGYEFRGKPEDFDMPDGAFRWGLGAGYPSRSSFRGIFELNGVAPSGDNVTITEAVRQSLRAVDGSLPPLVSATQSLTRANIGATWQGRNGFFVGGGLAWNVPGEGRDGFNTDSEPTGDFWDWQIRLGYHPGARRYVPPPPPPAPTPVAAPAPPVNRPPTVTAQCDPCTVEIGRTSTVTANATDPDGDPLTYAWKAAQGTLANPTARQSLWTAPQQEGTVPVTVTVSDGKGGTASATTNIQVVRPAARPPIAFEDVHFDFDRYSLRPEATRLLDDAVTALQQDATLRIQIEGHTCNIGTAEYNLALGDRRANSVRDYLISRGVPQARLTTVSYGEERPKYDNAREETRRLNRRAALVVNLQK